MWASPAAVWFVHGVFVGGGWVVVYCDDRMYRAIIVIALIILRILWTRKVISCAADAKLASVFQLAESRRPR
jgi:hypothetical protein